MLEEYQEVTRPIVNHRLDPFMSLIAFFFFSRVLGMRTEAEWIGLEEHELRG